MTGDVVYAVKLLAGSLWCMMLVWLVVTKSVHVYIHKDDESKEEDTK